MYDKEWIEYKKNLINLRYTSFNVNNHDIPLFSFIEYNLSNKCTRACSFCPVKNDDDVQFMDLKTYDESLKQLRDADFAGLIIYSGFSEPLLHPGLARFISLTKERLPDVLLGIASNGDLATKEKIRQVFDCGLDILALSLYDDEHQVESFTSIGNELKLKDKIFLRRRFLKDGNLNMIYCNRAGALPAAKEMPLKRNCYYPFYMLYIDCNGDVLFCSHDFNKQLILGSVGRDHLLQLWKGDVLERVRINLHEKCRTHLPCGKCDVTGTVMGEMHYKKWKELKNTSS
ncbi:MAG: SPASM domain-containing protein [Spirochaetales bacterium]|nr:SPASM domain-containing protein [Spirochaetales bacterium]